jgi:hypothetical protein
MAPPVVVRLAAVESPRVVAGPYGPSGASYECSSATFHVPLLSTSTSARRTLTSWWRYYW